MPGAPRPALRPWHASARGALLALALVVPGVGAAAERCVTGQDGRIAKVCYENVTGRAPYGHGVLGGTPEWVVLVVHATQGPAATTPPTHLLPRHVFEDIAPRLVDLDGDGADEIVAVQSSFENGARLVVLALSGDGRITERAATPYIGTRFRWLAPIGAADLDGDGLVEIAYIDRPHLAKRLRIWRFTNGALEHVIDAQGLTNHRIGEDFITGGIRDCGDGPEMLVADANWRNVMAVRFDGASVRTKPLQRFVSAAQVAGLLGCS